MKLKKLYQIDKIKIPISNKGTVRMIHEYQIDKIKIPISNEGTVRMIHENGINYVIIEDRNIQNTKIERAVLEVIKSRSPERIRYGFPEKISVQLSKMLPVVRINTEIDIDNLEDIFPYLLKDLKMYGYINNYVLKNRNVAYVQYTNDEDAQNAIKFLNGKGYMGRYGSKGRVHLYLWNNVK